LNNHRVMCLLSKRLTVRPHSCCFMHHSAQLLVAVMMCKAWRQVGSTGCILGLTGHHHHGALSFPAAQLHPIIQHHMQIAPHAIGRKSLRTA
jgi:hypothetical protein